MKYMKERFILCGILGWCMEIVFTSARCLITKDSRLMGHTSLWMFPIYGLAACIYPLNRVLKHFPSGCGACSTAEVSFPWNTPAA